jgi:hypothetical protein
MNVLSVGSSSSALGCIMKSPCPRSEKLNVSRLLFTNTVGLGSRGLVVFLGCFIAAKYSFSTLKIKT